MNSWPELLGSGGKNHAEWANEWNNENLSLLLLRNYVFLVVVSAFAMQLLKHEIWRTKYFAKGMICNIPIWEEQLDIPFDGMS